MNSAPTALSELLVSYIIISNQCIKGQCMINSMMLHLFQDNARIR